MKMMKRLLSSLMVIFLLGTVILPAAAAEKWSEEFCRVTDFTEELSDVELDVIDQHCVELVSRYRVDAAGLIIHASEYEGSTLSELGDYIYESGHFGYGETKDGFLVAFDPETKEICISLYGAAADLMTDRYVESLKTAALEQIDEYGIFGVILNPILTVKGDLQALVERGKYEANPAESSEAAAENSAPPVQSERSRVVDDAELFTDAEEAAMLEKIKAIQAVHEKDIVIYTTRDGQGKTHEAIATDFYEAGDYGMGEEKEGICMTIVMDPDDRGFLSAARGTKTRELYRQSKVEYMDDCLFEFVKDKSDSNGNKIPGNYGEGILNWLDQVDRLFTCGSPIAPFWLTGMDTGLEAAPPDRNTPRVTCEDGMMTEAELQELTARCKALSERLGIDIAINAAPRSYWMTMADYAARFYRSQGYGFHDSRDGMLLFIARSPDSSVANNTEIYVSGTPLEKLTTVNYDRMSTRTDDKLNFSGSPYKTAMKWLDEMEHMEKTGRVRRSAIYWGFMGFLGVFLSGILSVFLLIRDENKLKKPKLRKSAVEYAVPGSLKVNHLADSYRTCRITKTYAPVSKSSGQSSSGSSNYNSNYTSSSGNSYTTSGRKF